MSSITVVKDSFQQERSGRGYQIGKDGNVAAIRAGYVYTQGTTKLSKAVFGNSIAEIRLKVNTKCTTTPLMGIAKTNKFKSFSSDEIHEDDGTYLMNLFGAGCFNGKFRQYKDLNNTFAPHKDHIV